MVLSSVPSKSNNTVLYIFRPPLPGGLARLLVSYAPIISAQGPKGNALHGAQAGRAFFFAAGAAFCQIQAMRVV